MSELWNGDWIVFSICVVDSCCTTFSPMQAMVAVVYNRLNFFWQKGIKQCVPGFSFIRFTFAHVCTYHCVLFGFFVLTFGCSYICFLSTSQVIG